MQAKLKVNAKAKALHQKLTKSSKRRVVDTSDVLAGALSDVPERCQRLQRRASAPSRHTHTPRILTLLTP